jgi:hypothetical protein
MGLRFASEAGGCSGAGPFGESREILFYKSLARPLDRHQAGHHLFRNLFIA